MMDGIKLHKMKKKARQEGKTFSSEAQKCSQALDKVE
jgi:hypothetical protein